MPRIRSGEKSKSHNKPSKTGQGKKGVNFITQLKQELEEKKAELELSKAEIEAKNEMLLGKDKVISKLTKIIEDKPKYNHSISLLNQEILQDVAFVVKNGMFEISQIAAYLGIHRTTLQNWLKKGQDDQDNPDSLYLQLLQVYNYSKQVFFIANQTAINQAVKKGKTLDAKWNLESRFPALRTNTKSTQIQINDSLPIASKPSSDSEELVKVKREIEYIIKESVIGVTDDNDSSNSNED